MIVNIWIDSVTFNEKGSGGKPTKAIIINLTILLWHGFFHKASNGDGKF